jgi:trans-aconitate 2-methyltransferase
MTQTEDIKNWYNDFSTSQKVTGVNLRHFTIANKLISLGLKPNSTVLEIGCGIGTLTGLIANKTNKGALIATDISDESIRIAKERLSEYKHVDFIVSDMSDFNLKKTFDFIVLPDVMEHIPVDQHEELFAVIKNHMHKSSKILIHIPHPQAIQYYRETEPQNMQVIDQALSASKLLLDAYKNDLILIEYKAYSLFNKSYDYVFISFEIDSPKKMMGLEKIQIIIKKIIARLIYYSN